MIRKKISFGLEIMWLALSVLTFAAGIHKTYKSHIGESYHIFIFSALSLMFYFYRRFLRKRAINQVNK